MGEDPGTADARGRGTAGLRAGRDPEGRTAGSARPAGRNTRRIGPLTLDEAGLGAWGERIGSSVRPPAFFALRGELGAGKSVLARAIARGAGIRAVMPSPTFNLVLRYEADSGTTVMHLDLFRLTDPDEVWELGWGELGAEGEIVLVEWPERAELLLPPDRWDIRLESVGEPGRRRVTAIAVGTPAAIAEPGDG